MSTAVWHRCIGSSRTAIKVTYRHSFPDTGQCAFCGRRVKATLDGRVRMHKDTRERGQFIEPNTDRPLANKRLEVEGSKMSDPIAKALNMEAKKVNRNRRQPNG